MFEEKQVLKPSTIKFKQNLDD